MDFAQVAWWAYLAAGAAGAGFGVLQSLLMKRALLGEKPKKGLYAVKLLLWAAALTGMAFISVPLLLAFVAAASVTLIAVSFLLYQRSQKGAR